MAYYCHKKNSQHKNLNQLNDDQDDIFPLIQYFLPWNEKNFSKLKFFYCLYLIF